MDETTSLALISLRSPRSYSAWESSKIADGPGLYAIHAAENIWTELGLNLPPDDRPLYVGKSEASLSRRDLNTHFRTGRTGSSTLRRSLAALLRSSLQLSPEPRNRLNRERFANFSLDPDGDERLTQWMKANLQLAVWLSGGEVPVGVTERKMLDHWLPPLNGKDVRTPWSVQVSMARKAMADGARSWKPD